MIQAHYIYFVLYLYYYYISSTSDHQALDPRGWGALLMSSSPLKGPTSKYHHIEVRISTYEFGGHIQSIAIIFAEILPNWHCNLRASSEGRICQFVPNVKIKLTPGLARAQSIGSHMLLCTNFTNVVHIIK